MLLPEKLKDIVVAAKKRNEWRYSSDAYIIATELILTYLKEFKTITSYDEFTIEVGNLWFLNKPTPDGDIIFNALKKHPLGFSETETGKIYRSSVYCKDTGLVACTASILQDNKDVWSLIAPLLTGGTN